METASRIGISYEVRYGGIGHGWFVARVMTQVGKRGFTTTASGPYTTREQAEQRARELAEAAS